MRCSSIDVLPTEKPKLQMSAEPKLADSKETETKTIKSKDIRHPVFKVSSIKASKTFQDMLKLQGKVHKSYIKRKYFRRNL